VRGHDLAQHGEAPASPCVGLVVAVAARAVFTAAASPASVVTGR
jgi:hypothetical protein